jgi:hypothetical protein
VRSITGGNRKSLNFGLKDYLACITSSKPLNFMIGSHCELPQTALKAENVLAFDWRELTALGVSWEEARSIATTLITKQFMLRYWRQLIRTGVPIDDARRIARAVAKFDWMGLFPTLQQQVLIQYYCPAVCRAGLWRAELLLQSRSADNN